MECEYCQQEDADTQINNHWYHKECYIELRRKEEKLTTQDKLTFINCFLVIVLCIILFWLLVRIWPLLTALP